MTSKTFFVALALAVVQAAPTVCSSTISCKQGYYSVAATATADAKCVTCTKNTAILGQHEDATRTCTSADLGQRLTAASGKTRCASKFHWTLGAAGADDTCTACTAPTAAQNEANFADGYWTCTSAALASVFTKSGAFNCKPGFYYVAAVTSGTVAPEMCSPCTTASTVNYPGSYQLAAGATINQPAASVGSCTSGATGLLLTANPGYYVSTAAAGAAAAVVTTCTYASGALNGVKVGTCTAEATGGDLTCDAGFYKSSNVATNVGAICSTCTYASGALNGVKVGTCTSAALGGDLTCDAGFYKSANVATNVGAICTACPATGTGLLKPTNLATGATTTCSTATSGWVITAATNGAKCADGYSFLAKTGTDPQSDSCVKCTHSSTKIVDSCCGVTCGPTALTVAIQTTWAPTTCPGTTTAGGAGGQSSASAASLSIAALLLVAISAL